MYRIDLLSLFLIAHRQGAPFFASPAVVQKGTDVLGSGVPVHSRTAPFSTGLYTFYMKLESIKATVATVWVSAVCISGIAANLKSLSGWTVLAGVAVLPPVVMMWQWNNPRQTISESIQEALQ